MSINGLQTAVLEAGGHIEDRMLISDFPNFTPVYTFTREALEKLLANERRRCAIKAKEIWWIDGSATALEYCDAILGMDPL